MKFNKHLHAANFEFSEKMDPQSGALALARGRRTLSLEDMGDDIHRLTARGGSWNRNESCWAQFPDGRGEAGASEVSVELEAEPVGVRCVDGRGRVRLQSVAGRGFGVCGESFMMGFALEGGERFYGMGEKFLGLELSQKCTKFWNTDAMGDFPPDVFTNGRPDPAYVSIPYLVVKTKAGWVGILVNNPGAVMMDTGAAVSIEGFMAVQEAGRYLLIGAETGQPDVFFLFADSLAGLTRKFQGLVGRTPRPPVWALGYHQCRWGYRSAEELAGYKARFAEEGIPVDGLWLDIDYMRGYRVFTFSEEHFPDVEADLAALQAEGQRVVPIIDPGVKVDPEWEVYQDGEAKGVFCKNPQGRTFVGQVWPGDTAFVDYMLPKGMRWWRDRVAAFARRGIHGCWNDMNDPSTGFVDHPPMLWAKGTKAHEVFHNQFAKAMAESTRDGFLLAHPDERPFILSRSGSTGMGRVAAIWHGDSSSNDHWLRLAVPTALNLSLSGVPFNGPDLGGFGGDTNPRLFTDYVKACFLFPFCRNHTAIHTARQEPWAMGEEVLAVSRAYIRSRYQLRPYLYQLFVRQSDAGDPVLRPLFYEFEREADAAVWTLEDQFMVGPALMQAPLLGEERTREVLLPKGRWFNFMTSKWMEGGRRVRVTPRGEQTPLYGRAGESVVMTRETPTSHPWDGRTFDVHLLLEAGGKGRVRGEVVSDDGSSFGYTRGEQSRVAYSATSDGSTLRVSTRTLEDGYGPLDLSFVVYGRFETVTVNGRAARLARWTYPLAGTDQKVFRVAG